MELTLRGPKPTYWYGDSDGWLVITPNKVECAACGGSKELDKPEVHENHVEAQKFVVVHAKCKSR